MRSVRGEAGFGEEAPVKGGGDGIEARWKGLRKKSRARKGSSSAPAESRGNWGHSSPG